MEKDGEFCCLGVLCHVLHQRPELGVEMQRRETPYGSILYATRDSDCTAMVPYSRETHELGLSIKMPTVGHRAIETVLVSLNDNSRASFAEIAQFIGDAVMPLLRAEGVLPQREAAMTDRATQEI